MLLFLLLHSESTFPILNTFIYIKISVSKSGVEKDSSIENAKKNKANDLHDVMNQLMDDVMKQMPTIEHL